MKAINSVTSTLTCPNCGEQTTETMPGDACIYFWECPYCKEVIKPLDGDCCVFCSFGEVDCPPVQEKEDPEVS